MAGNIDKLEVREAPRAAEAQKGVERNDFNEGMSHSAETVSAVEAVGELAEGMESVDGKVSETMSESRKKASGAKDGKGGSKVVDPAVIRAQILKNIPTQAVMRKQVSKEIRKEIKYLHRKAMKMMTSPGEVSYFEMSNLMKKVRELKGILATLAKATVENLKTLWLRFVHGVL